MELNLTCLKRITIEFTRTVRSPRPSASYKNNWTPIGKEKIKIKTQNRLGPTNQPTSFKASYARSVKNCSFMLTYLCPSVIVWYQTVLILHFVLHSKWINLRSATLHSRRGRPNVLFLPVTQTGRNYRQDNHANQHSDQDLRVLDSTGPTWLVSRLLFFMSNDCRHTCSKQWKIVSLIIVKLMNARKCRECPIYEN